MSKRTHEDVRLDPYFDTIPLELYEMIVKCLGPLDFYRFSLTSSTNHEQMKLFKRPFSAVFSARCHPCGNRSYNHKCSPRVCPRRGPGVSEFNWNMFSTQVSRYVVSLQMSRSDESAYIDFRVSEPVCPFWESERANEEYDLFSLFAKDEIYHVNEEEECAEHSYALIDISYVWSAL